MAKQVIDKNIKEIRALIKKKGLIIGTERTMKYVKLGKVDKVYLASNCSDKVKGDLEYYRKINEFDIVKLKYPNDELGNLCKKPFSISVLSVLKGGK